MPLLNANSILGNPLAMAGLGLLAQPTRSRYPINPMASVLGGLQAAGQFQQNQQQFAGQQAEMQMRQQRLQFEMDEALRQKEETALKRALEERDRAAIEAQIATLPPEQQAIARLDPAAYAKGAAGSLFREPNEEPSAVQTYRLTHPDDVTLSGFDRWNRENKRSGATNVNMGAPYKLPSGYMFSDPGDPSKGVARIPGMEPTEGQAAAGNYATRMQEASTRLAEIESNPSFDPTDLGQNAATRIPVVGNYALSSEFQQYQQAKEDWVRAKLRKESGAVIAKEEMQKEFETYFPVPGDTPETIRRKAQARRIAEQGMSDQAGSAAPEKPKVRRYNPQTGTIE